MNIHPEGNRIAIDHLGIKADSIPPYSATL